MTCEYRGAYVIFRITAEVVNVLYVMVSPALMAPTLVTASDMMAELGPVPLGPRQAVECAEHAIIFVS